MKLLMALLILSLVALVVAEETYSTENDDLDIEALVSDDNQLKAFNGCFVDTSACNEVMADFKKDLLESVQQACAKCTPAQKHIMKRYFEGLQQKMPQGLEAFKKKYDPKNKYFANLEKAIANA